MHWRFPDFLLQSHIMSNITVFITHNFRYILVGHHSWASYWTSISFPHLWYFLEGGVVMKEDNSVFSEHSHKTFSNFKSVLKPADILAFISEEAFAILKVQCQFMIKVVHFLLLVATFWHSFWHFRQSVHFSQHHLDILFFSGEQMGHCWDKGRLK